LLAEGWELSDATYLSPCWHFKVSSELAAAVCFAKCSWSFCTLQELSRLYLLLSLAS